MGVGWDALLGDVFPPIYQIQIGFLFDLNATARTPVLVIMTQEVARKRSWNGETVKCLETSFHCLFQVEKNQGCSWPERFLGVVPLLKCKEPIIVGPRKVMAKDALSKSEIID